MILLRVVNWCVCFLFFFSGVIYAADSDADVILQTGFLPVDSMHANWVFSGMVASEDGDHYAYLFQMQRHGNDFHTTVALFDVQTKSMLFMEEGNATMAEPERYNWHVGHTFLRFNPINDSWIFGLKTHDKRGFNFKVDMLNQSEHNSSVQGLRSGVDVIVTQTGQLNGHIQIAKEAEQFVAAKSTWFRQVWLSTSQNEPHHITGVLCRFDDDSGFYSMNMLEPDALRGAVTGWFDAQGAPVLMSQFINAKEGADGSWHIRATSPHLDLTLFDTIKKPSIVLGFVMNKNKQGFCVVNEDVIGEVSSEHVSQTEPELKK